MDAMSSRDTSVVPPARTWLTLVPFLVAVAVAATVGAAVATCLVMSNSSCPEAPIAWNWANVAVEAMMFGEV